MTRVPALAALFLTLAAGTAGAAEVPYQAASFQKALAQGDPVAVDFAASWCPVCKAQAPVLRSITAEPAFKGLTLFVADYDTEKALRKTLNVSEQSTLVVFHHGKEVARSTGDTTQAALTKLLRTSLN